MSTQHQSSISHNRSKKYHNFSFIIDNLSSVNITSKINTFFISSVTHITLISQAPSPSLLKSDSMTLKLKKITADTTANIFINIFIVITLYISILGSEVVEASFFDEINVEDFFEV